MFDRRYLWTAEWFVEDPPRHFNCRCGAMIYDGHVVYDGQETG